MLAGRPLLVAHVLHVRPYLGGRRIVELFTRAQGRVAAVALRRSAAERALLTPFTQILVDIKGRGELKSLSALEATTVQTPRLHGPINYCGLYLNELLIRLLPQEDPYPAVFDRYQLVIAQLSSLTVLADAEPQLRAFELLLLGELGVGLELSSTAAGEPLTAENHYRLVLDLGLEPTSAERDPRQLIFSGADYLAICANDYGAGTTRQAAKAIARACLSQLLGSTPLKSRELFGGS